MTAPIENIVEVGENAKWIMPFAGMKAPVFNIELRSVGGPLTQYLGHQDDPTRSFPNIALAEPPIEQMWGSDLSYSYRLHGINGGRTEHQLETSIGIVTAHVSYLFTYFGDAEHPSSFRRVVLPVFLGWRSSDDATSFSTFFYATNVTSNPYWSPNGTGSLLQVSDVALALDPQVGRSVFAVEFPSGTSSDVLATVAAWGWPVKLFTSDSLNASALLCRDVYRALQRLTVETAYDQGYTLYHPVSGEQVATPLDDIVQDVLEASDDVLPDAFDIASKQEITVDELGVIPSALHHSLYQYPQSIFDDA